MGNFLRLGEPFRPRSLPCASGAGSPYFPSFEGLPWTWFVRAQGVLPLGPGTLWQHLDDSSNSSRRSPSATIHLSRVRSNPSRPGVVTVGVAALRYVTAKLTAPGNGYCAKASPRWARRKGLLPRPPFWTREASGHLSSGCFRAAREKPLGRGHLGSPGSTRRRSVRDRGDQRFRCARADI